MGMELLISNIRQCPDTKENLYIAQDYWNNTVVQHLGEFIDPINYKVIYVEEGHMFYVRKKDLK